MPERLVMRKRKVEIEGGRALWFYEFDSATPQNNLQDDDSESEKRSSEDQGRPKGMLEDRTE